MKQFLLKSILFSVIFFGFGIIAFIVIKARQSSSSWLTVDSSNPATLYVGAGETLTAAKRNKLVQNAVREEVVTTDTAVFDNNCDRKRQIDYSTYDNIYYSTNIRNDWSRITYSNSTSDYYVENTSKWTTKYNGSDARTNLHIWKRCK